MCIYICTVAIPNSGLQLIPSYNMYKAAHLSHWQEAQTLILLPS